MKDLVFTVDVEEWKHAENVRPYIKDEPQYNDFSTIAGLRKILEFLESRSYKGTFFFLADLAIKNKTLIREISKLGHEIGSHGLDHTLLNNLGDKKTFHDVNESKKIIEDITGIEVKGYRSPCFSQNNYLNDALIKSGYLYTSMSIRSSFHDRYSNNKKDSDLIRDFSLPTVSFGGFNLVCTGGGWFRLYPVEMQKFLLHFTKSEPNIFYCHPWDFVKNLPGNDIKIPFFKKFRHTINVQRAYLKLTKFDFTKTTLKDYV